MRTINPALRIGLPTALATAWRHRHLLITLTRREITGRYRGAWLGGIWPLLTPLLLLGIYTFIFGLVFRVRWNDAGTTMDGEFAAILFSGIIIHGLLSEVLNRSPASITNNKNLVKKVVFPLDLLAWVTVLGALFHFLLAFIVLVAFLLITGHAIPITAIALPLVLLPFLLFALGIAWFVSSLGVFVRDIGQVTGLLATALLFLSPIFYPLSAVPEAYRGLIRLNPLTHIVEEIRNLLMSGIWPDPVALLLYSVMALGVCWLGYAWFQKTRCGFADVL